MKRKALRNGLIVSALAMTICLSAAIVATSCQKQRFDEDPALPHSKVAEEWPYLDFTDDFNGDFDNPQDTNSLLLIEAVQRAHLAQEDGLWKISSISAAQIRVAPRVFDYLQQIVELGNAVILEDLKISNLVPRMRQFGDPHSLIEPARSDCFASCAGFMADKLGYPVTYAEINTYVTERYGSGIPLGQILPNLQYFFGPNNASRFSMGNIGNYNSDLFRVMVVFSTGVGEGHAVMYWGPHSDSTYMVSDPQKGNLPYPINKSDVIDAFKVLHK